VTFFFKEAGNDIISAIQQLHPCNCACEQYT